MKSNCSNQIRFHTALNMQEKIAVQMAKLKSILNFTSHVNVIKNTSSTNIYLPYSPNLRPNTWNVSNLWLIVQKCFDF